jgi:hypothetical protein
VAAVGRALGAHEADDALTRELLEPAQSALEIVGLHPRFVTALAEPAQALAQPRVIEPVDGKLALDVLAREMRTAARAREPTYVAQKRYLHSAAQSNQPVERMH